jgi:hypothetical protein
MEERFIELLPILTLGTLLFIGYRIEKLHNMLGDWYGDWHNKNFPKDSEDNE